MQKFYVVMLPANTTGVQHDVFYTSSTSWWSTDLIEEATRFKNESAAQDHRSELNMLWRCCAQIRAVEVIPSVAEQLKLRDPGMD